MSSTSHFMSVNWTVHEVSACTDEPAAPSWHTESTKSGFHRIQLRYTFLFYRLNATPYSVTKYNTLKFLCLHINVDAPKNIYQLLFEIQMNHSSHRHGWIHYTVLMWKENGLLKRYFAFYSRYLPLPKQTWRSSGASTSSWVFIKTELWLVCWRHAKLIRAQKAKLPPTTWPFTDKQRSI